MKSQRTEALQARVSPRLRLDVKRYAEKNDLAEADVIRLALRNFFASKSIKNTSNATRDKEENK